MAEEYRHYLQSMDFVDSLIFVVLMEVHLFNNQYFIICIVFNQNRNKIIIICSV